MNVSLEHILTECDRLGINGLLFQHIHLCPTRTWLHNHCIDFTHLNRPKQAGLLLHATAYGTDVEALMPRPPGLKGRSGNLELCGGLTLGDALGAQRPVLRKEVRTFESIPAWLAVMVALLRVLDEGFHSDLLCSSLAL